MYGPKHLDVQFFGGGGKCDMYGPKYLVFPIFLEEGELRYVWIQRFCFFELFRVVGT
jgi:hypothetical protein